MTASTTMATIRPADARIEPRARGEARRDRAQDWSTIDIPEHWKIALIL